MFLTKSLIQALLLCTFCCKAFALSINYLPDLPTGPDSETSSNPAEVFYLQGLAALTEKKYKEAKDAFEQSLAKDKNYVNAYLGLAEVANQNGETLELENTLKKALALEPKNPHALLSLGKLRYKQREYDKAEQALKSAIEADPSFVSAQVTLGDLYLNVSTNIDGAIAAYKQALLLDPTHSGARFALASAYERKRNNKLALAEYQKVAKQEPNNPVPLARMGDIYLSTKAYAKATSAFDAALKIDPKMTKALIGKGDVLAAQNEGEKAKSYYLKALNTNADGDEANFKLAMMYQTKGDLAAAKRHYKRAIASNDKLLIAYNNLAWIAIEQNKDLNKAVTWAERAAELAPSSPVVLDTLGWTYFNAGKTKKAVKTLRDAIALNGDLAETHFHLGLALKKENKPEQALAALEKALSLEPEFKQREKAETEINAIKKTLNN